MSACVGAAGDDRDADDLPTVQKPLLESAPATTEAQAQAGREAVMRISLQDLPSQLPPTLDAAADAYDAAMQDYRASVEAVARAEEAREQAREALDRAQWALLMVAGRRTQAVTRDE